MHTRHALSTATVDFKYYIENISVELARWVQYKGYEVNDGNKMFFIFESSQRELTFKVYAGISSEETEFEILNSCETIYTYFREIKYDILKSKGWM